MPAPETITRATLQPITWGTDGGPDTYGDEFEVQFNPETLKLTFSNQVAGGNQAGGSSIQFNSKGKTKLAFDLFFDVTDPQIASKFSKKSKPESTADVRKISNKVLAYMQTEPDNEGEETRYVPSGVRFTWGSFRFDGVMDSVNETLDFFSADGIPLRSTVSVSLTKQDVDTQFGDVNADSQGDPIPGTKKTPAAQQNDSMSNVVGRQGNPEKWHGDALANKIENSRDIPLGTPLQLGTTAAAAINRRLAGGPVSAAQAAVALGPGLSTDLRGAAATAGDELTAAALAAVPDTLSEVL
jgi:hypothetical protein